MSAFSASDHRFMARALELARRGLYSTDPNPRVGCVLVKDGEIVGEGFHQRAGQPHAEPLAILDAGDHARGATAYVTLEPCSHHGKTPPCSSALIDAGVTRVVAAMEDPNPLVSGSGLKLLEEAGIATSSGLLEQQAEALNPGFNKRMRSGMPWVRVKLAMSLDGRTAMASGESVWITGSEARQDVQYLRARSSAILTGVGTVLHDDPSMNVRLDPEDLALPARTEVRQPLRVILDSSLRTSPTAKLLSLPGETLIYHANGEAERAVHLENTGAKVAHCPNTEEQVDLEQVLRDLAKREINEVLIEAGPTLAGSALQSGLLDEIVVYMAPHLMGDQARGLFQLPGIEAMNQRIPLEIVDVRMVGQDLRLNLKLNQSGVS
ncbi:MAG: bifunctional diaminohydroxyphosphoribosylaminopyrimidine deaminase/5-amino-6-(5-phosphoribosylamino)uracil reductase RibD [bacterium]